MYRAGSGWRAQITNRGTQCRLGTFPSPEAAARAYDFAAVVLRGDFAVLNLEYSPEEIAEMKQWPDVIAALGTPLVSNSQQ